MLVGAAGAPGGVEPPSAPVPGGATTVILVRHAEKASTEDDSPLTEAGARRADALVRALEDADVSAVYSSQYRRNLETARPLAERLGQTPRVVSLESEKLAESLESMKRRLLAEHSGETVVVVGHSNTVPMLMELLGVEEAPRLSDEDYDDLFVVTVIAGGEARWLHLHYGEPSG
jgi:broad specificity phosphatase PhoE